MHPLTLSASLASVVALISAWAEYRHVARIRAASPLVFGPAGGPRPWTSVLPIVRVLGFASLAWSFAYLTLAEPELFDASGRSKAERERTLEEHAQRVLLVLDISPSMNVKDAGEDQALRRRDRVYEVVESMLSRIAMSRTRFSVVVFFTSARPVVVDARDPQVVRNILDNLPLVWSFEPGETQLIAGLEEACELADDWPPDSTTLFLCTDGDTVDFSQIPTLPASIRALEILAVGDPLVATRVGGRDSRQQASVLKRLAAELKGAYHNVNRRNIPSHALSELAIVPEPPQSGMDLAELARWMAVAAAGALAVLPMAEQYWGSAWNPHRELSTQAPMPQSGGSR